MSCRFVNDNDTGGNTCAVKDIGRQSDNGINIILFNQILPDFTFFAAAETRNSSSPTIFRR